ncbi:MAG TPA: hypothetical protein VF141_18395, partial [Chryseolinea sp.]
LVVSAMLWPTVSRLFLSAIFIGASAFNLVNSFVNPSSYLELGEFAEAELYRSFILGPFSSNVTLFVSTIAICQLFIGVFISYRGKLMRVAMAGGIIFLIGISPLDYGAAFPAPMIMAMALGILFFRHIQYSIFEIIFPDKNYSKETS